MHFMAVIKRRIDACGSTTSRVFIGIFGIKKRQIFQMKLHTTTMNYGSF